LGLQVFYFGKLMLNFGVQFGLMIVIVTQGRVDLRQGKMRMLKMNFLWTPTIGNI
jgi:hypothetical protein